MYVYVITPPSKTKALIQPVEVRIARSVANLFGVIYPDPDYDWTWVSELRRLSLVEVAGGCPRPQKSADPGSGNDRVPTPDPSKKPISPTSMQEYGLHTDTLSAVVLAGCNTLYADISASTERALKVLFGSTGTGLGSAPLELRLQVTAAMVIEAYLAAPALFIAGAEARASERRYFNSNREVLFTGTSAHLPARCETRPGRALGSETSRSLFEFEIIDRAISSIPMQTANGVPIVEAPSWSGLAGAVASELSKTIQRIGSPRGRGIIRVTEPLTDRWTLEAFAPIQDIVRAFAETVSAWIDHNEIHAPNISELFRHFDPSSLFAELIDTPYEVEGLPKYPALCSAVLGLCWAARLYCVDNRTMNDDLVHVVAALKKTLEFLDSRFPQEDDLTIALIMQVRIVSGQVSLQSLRRAFIPDGDVGEIQKAVVELNGALNGARNFNFRNGPSKNRHFDSGRYLDALYYSYESFNGIRRDLLESSIPEHQALLEQLTRDLEDLWTDFFNTARQWTESMPVDLRISDVESVMAWFSTGEFAFLLHNFASFRGFDDKAPDHLADSSKLFRKVVLPARDYQPGKPESAASAVPRPHLLQYSLEVASRADAALARLYESVNFHKLAIEHGNYALEYAQAVTSMIKWSEIDDAPGFHAAQTAEHIANAFVAAAEVFGMSELSSADVASLEQAREVGLRWTKKFPDTALARKFDRLNASYATTKVGRRP